MNKTKKVIKEETAEFNAVRFIIQRFELNDSINPAYYVIGFKIFSDINQREQYIETMVDYKNCIDKSDNEILELAYNQLKSKIDEVIDSLSKKTYIIGSEFIPPQK